MSSGLRLFTIGHSNHPVENLLLMLKQHAITSVCDVRSSPYSRYVPQFNRESIERYLENEDIRYVYMGEQLGGRSKDPEHYDHGQIQYDAIAASPAFMSGLVRLRDEIANETVALMCTEKDPLNCHRSILVCRHLRQEFEVLHILGDGTLETNPELEERLRKSLNIPAQDLFEDYATLIARAYDLQGKKIAFSSTPENGSAEKD